MAASRTRQLLQSRDNAIDAARLLLNWQDTQFELVLFEKFVTVAKLHSKHYNSYFVLCHTNTLCSAGWLICQYAKNGCCSLDRALHCFKRYTEEHQGSIGACKVTKHIMGPFNFSGSYQALRRQMLQKLPLLLFV